MPIPANEWSALIRGTLERLADADYQKLAWFNKHEGQTSPEEQICQILDDYQFEEYTRSPQIGLSIQQQKSALALVNKLKRFGGSSRVPFNPYKVIDDPKWAAVRAESKKVLVTLFEN